MKKYLLEIVSWMNNNMLKINEDETEVIVFSSQKKEKQQESLCVTIGDETIPPTKCVRNLGAFMDSKISMKQHITAVCKAGYGQLRQIGHIRKYLNTDATKTLVNSLVTSRLDYCSSLLYGVPKTMINRLQILQNTAARIITKTPRYEHITPVLKELRDQRVKFKILLYTFKALKDQAPSYLNLQKYMCQLGT